MSTRPPFDDDAIDRILQEASVSSADDHVLDRVRGRVERTVGAGGGGGRLRRRLPMIAALAIPAAAAAMLAGALVLRGQPEARRVVTPAATPSPSRTESPAPSPNPTTTPAPTPWSVTTLRSLVMTSSSTGWALADEVAVHTRDGGHTWTRRPVPGGPVLVQYVFFDADHAWAFGIDNGGQRGPIPTRVSPFTTADAGVTWTASPPFTIPGTLAGPQFVDFAHGWLTAMGGAAAGSNQVTLFRTVDGGASWRQVAQGTPGDTSTAPGHMPGSCDKQAPVFSTPEDGFLTGYCPGPDPLLYVSHDGGVTWKDMNRALPPAGLRTGYVTNCQCRTFPPQFASPAHGYLLLDGMVEAGPLHTLYVTTDGGATWFGRALPGRPTDPGYFNASPLLLLHMVVPESSPAQGPGPVYRSLDEGASWTQPKLPGAGGDGFDDPWFISPSEGWDRIAWSDRIRIFHTKDGGSSWSEIPYTVN